MTLLLAALLSLHSPDLARTSSFRFRPFDSGLPRSGQWRHGFAVADFNSDGLPDLAFTSPRKQPGPPVLFLNQGGGRWARWEQASFPDLPFDYGAVAAADFDGQGGIDLAVGAHYVGVTVLLGDGTGRFVLPPNPIPFPTPSFSSRALTTADWNADGLADVVALSDGPRIGIAGAQLGVTVFENGVSSWNQLRAPSSDRVYGDSIAAGDIDGDGLPDLVTASSLVYYKRVLRLGADHTLEGRELATSLPVSVVTAVDLGDFDANGRDEVVIAYSSATEPRQVMLELVPYPEATPRVLWSEENGSAFAAVAAGDINGDGSADLVAAIRDGRLLTFRGDGRGFVTRDAEIEPPQWRRGCTPYGLGLADLDGDGRDEIVVSFAGESGCASRGGIEVWRAEFSNRRRSVGR